MSETKMSPFEIFPPSGEVCKDFTLDVNTNSQGVPDQGGNNWNVTFH